ncbi:unnamed protein product, partial [Phaeothamnion confervicola]
LDEPYAIQPTAAVFERLLRMLRQAAAHLQNSRRHTGPMAAPAAAAAGNVVLALLTLIQANLHRLVDSEVDPYELGFFARDSRRPTAAVDAAAAAAAAATAAIEEDGASALSPLHCALLACLSGLLNSSAADGERLACAAADAFSAGLPVLVPRLADRLGLLLRGIRWSGGGGGGGGGGGSKDCDESDGGAALASLGCQGFPCVRLRLLAALMRHFSRTEMVLQLLEANEQQPRHRPTLEELLYLLINATAGPPPLPQPPPPQRSAPAVGNPGTPAAVAAAAAEAVATEARELVAADGLVLLDTLQQHLVHAVLEGGTGDSTTPPSPAEALLCRYAPALLRACLAAMTTPAGAGAGGGQHECEEVATGSATSPCTPAAVTRLLLLPMLHGLFLCAKRQRLAAALLPPTVALAGKLSVLIAREVAVIESTLRAMALPPPRRDLLLAAAADHWRPVAAGFEEEPRAAAASFRISDEGRVYTALTSSNTCALLDVGFRNGRAAWEARLESDSLSDECSLFGAAVKPLTSRCYSSSSSLFMRRSYNGVLYARGRQLGSTKTMPKIHPGDVVRCELDCAEGTLRFAINGQEQDGGFQGLEGEIFPCVGSYRSGVRIRLLKVEAMGGGGGGGCGVLGGGVLDGVLTWRVPRCAKVSRSGALSCARTEIEARRARMAPAVLLASGAAEDWTTARLRDGTARESGRHAVHFDLGGSAAAAVPRLAFGMTSAWRPPEAVLLGSFAGSWAWLSDGSLWAHGRAYAGPDAAAAKAQVSDPCSTEGDGSDGDDAGSDCDDDLRRCGGGGRCGVSSIGAGGDDDDDGDNGGGGVAVKLHDSAISPAQGRAVVYGAELLPLSPLDVVTVTLDTARDTLSFAVNGVSAGIAFGPPGSGAACEVPVSWPRSCASRDDGAPGNRGEPLLYAAVSVSREQHAILPRAGGPVGTQVWPAAYDVHRTAVALSGALAATLV